MNTHYHPAVNSHAKRAGVENVRAAPASAAGSPAELAPMSGPAGSRARSIRNSPTNHSEVEQVSFAVPDAASSKTSLFHTPYAPGVARVGVNIEGLLAVVPQGVHHVTQQAWVDTPSSKGFFRKARPNHLGDWLDY
jgi:hypothetical protein